ncbi:MAG: hypothetical protein JRJ84_21395 [Deltaproteobacteria bacterium]|nr:hypothetical protein [Deltaproteobacteria bacterium]
MARAFPPEEVQVAFLYVREAHPGENRPAHRSMDDKIEAARSMIERWDMRRPMLVDSLEGDLHRAYGLLPNMTWIIDRRGRVAYKASWTDGRTIRQAVEQLRFEEKHRAQKTRLLPYDVEWRPARPANRAPFLEGLLRNGPRAVREYIEAVEFTLGKPSGRPLREWWAGQEDA